MKLVFLMPLALATSLALSGCNPDPNVATPNQVIVGINAYNAGVATARAYLALPLCSATVGAPCRTQALSQSVYTALVSARAAETQLLAALKANATVPITAVQALQAAYAVIQAIPQN